MRRNLNATTGMKTRSDLIRHGRVIVRFVRVLRWKEICSSTEGTRLGALKTRASALRHEHNFVCVLPVYAFSMKTLTNQLRHGRVLP